MTVNVGEQPSQRRDEKFHIASDVGNDENVNTDGRGAEMIGEQLDNGGETNADPHLTDDIVAD